MFDPLILGISFGSYNYEKANPDKDNMGHYATLEETDESGVYKWSNDKGESWKLYRTGEQDRLRVGKECPHYEGGYTIAEFENGMVLGPDEQPFYLQVEQGMAFDEVLNFLNLPIFLYFGNKISE